MLHYIFVLLFDCFIYLVILQPLNKAWGLVILNKSKSLAFQRYYLINEVENGIDEHVKGRTSRHYESPPPPPVVLQRGQDKTQHQHDSKYQLTFQILYLLYLDTSVMILYILDNTKGLNIMANQHAAKMQIWISQVKRFLYKSWKPQKKQANKNK